MSDESNSVSDQSNSNNEIENSNADISNSVSENGSDVLQNLIPKNMDLFKDVMRSIIESLSKTSNTEIARAIQQWFELTESEKCSALSELGLIVLRNIGKIPLTLCQWGVVLSLIDSRPENQDQLIVIQEQFDFLNKQEWTKSFTVSEFRQLMEFGAYLRAVTGDLAEQYNSELFQFAQRDAFMILNGTKSVSDIMNEEMYKNKWTQIKTFLSQNKVLVNDLSSFTGSCHQSFIRMIQLDFFLTKFKSALLRHLNNQVIVNNIITIVMSTHIQLTSTMEKWMYLPETERTEQEIFSHVVRIILGAINEMPLTIRQAGLLVLVAGKKETDIELLIHDDRQYCPEFSCEGKMSASRLYWLMWSIAALNKFGY